jgi:hypothetical protein
MSDDFDVIPTDGDVDGKRYSDFIEDYWHFLLGPNPDNPVYNNTIFTRGCQNYRDVYSNVDVRRENFCGILPETPSQIHTVGSQNNPFKNTSNYPVFVTVLDTLAVEPGIDENGGIITQDDVLQVENAAVTPQDVRLTIRKIRGGGPQTDVEVFKNHRTGADFSLNVLGTSVLAEHLEYKIRVGSYPNAKTLGYYVLIKFNTGGVYNINSTGHGVRGYISRAAYYIEIP